MSLVLFTPDGGTPINYIGAQEMRDMFIPKPGKDEYGMDTMDRSVRGPAYLYEGFIDGLSQGDVLNGFFLQTWRPIEHNLFPGVSMAYKGLLGGALPDPKGADDVSLMSITTSTDSPSKATMDISFEATTTTWRYVLDYRPTDAMVGHTASGRDPRVRSAVIRTEDGKEYFGTAPIGLVTALIPAIENKMIGLRAVPVIGTPYFECEETIGRVYVGQGAT